jgi:hypothetical protein
MSFSLADCSEFVRSTNSCLAGMGISLINSALRLVAPTEVFRTVAPTRRPNAELRTRGHLTPGEVEALIEAAEVSASN